MNGMTVSAVQQAVDLLVGRLAEARQRYADVTTEAQSLTDEIASIEDAVQKLTGLAAPNPVRTSPHAESPPASIRAAVKQILEGESMAYSSSTIRALLPTAVTEGKTPDQIANSVRSALWSLRQSGEAIMTQDGTVSLKWPGFIASGIQTSPGDDDPGEPTGRERGVRHEEGVVVDSEAAANS